MIYISIILLSFLILTKAIKIGRFTSLIDNPSKLKIHDSPTPVIGGLIIFINLLFVLFFYKYFGHKSLDYFFLLYIFFFFLIGFLDDVFRLKSIIRIILVIFLSSYFIFIQEGFVIEKVFFSVSNNKFYFGEFKFIVTLICILLLFIAFNLADGINCLIISFCICAILIYNFVIFKSQNLDIVSVAILLSLIVMFYYNYRNKIFLGNSGASLLSGYFIYLLISKNSVSNTDVFHIISAPLIMGIDMIRLFVERIINKKNIFDRDNNHFHHILLKNFKLKKSISIYMFLSFFPIIFSTLFKMQILFFILLSIAIYFILIKKFK